MCSLKKNALIFQVGNDIKDPIVVIEQKHFTKQEPDSCVPLLGIYDGTHYQSVIPASKEDEQITVDIVKYFPNFQGNFKSFLANHQNMKKTLVPTIVQENCGIEQGIFQVEPTNYGPSNFCDVPLSEQANFEIEPKDEDSKIKLKDDGSNISYEVPLTEEANSENEMKDFGSNKISEPENSEVEEKKEGINLNDQELALEQENSENEAKRAEQSSYKEPYSEPENSETEANKEGININNEELALEKEDFENEATHEGINSSCEGPASEQENSEIEVKKDNKVMHFYKKNLYFLEGDTIE